MTEQTFPPARCGICNRIIEDDEKWTEIDCVICEYCSYHADDYIPEPEDQVKE